MMRFAVSIILIWCLSPLATADTVYQKPDDFLHTTFGAKLPAAQFVWLDKTMQQSIKEVLGHPYPQLRIRYWRGGEHTAWILDDIGKEFPITAGFVVADNTIDSAQVLVYRESRGDEIHVASFLKQFAGLQLKDSALSKHVDGITGATLSVNAMKRMAQIALMLNRAAP